MKKIIKLKKELNDIRYIYRISSVSIDKITLEKHLANVRDTFVGTDLAVKIGDETKVGTVTQKVVAELIADVSKKVDSAVIDFEMNDKHISKMTYEGIIEEIVGA